MEARRPPKPIAPALRFGAAASLTRPLPGYFYRLSAAGQRTYLASNALERYEFDPGARARATARRLMDELEAGRERSAAMLAHELALELCLRAEAPRVAVTVRGVRPHNTRGELHGIYYHSRPPRIVLWMRTAQRHDVVKPRTFLRTLLHEIGHHFDYTVLGLGDSYHTTGFFKRESWLMRALIATEQDTAHEQPRHQPQLPKRGEARGNDPGRDDAILR
jgi:hypothetical protein